RVVHLNYENACRDLPATLNTIAAAAGNGQWPSWWCRLERRRRGTGDRPDDAGRPFQDADSQKEKTVIPDARSNGLPS
ncbi:hypothetical protein, partial [Magnetospirillum moscoviense]|uniref:hypothetical protein n=1 Tax=Magnetospirillum moscoviense TaxID=1437059 RepID=UPI001C12CA6A